MVFAGAGEDDGDIGRRADAVEAGVHCNWRRRHSSIRATPAQAAGLADERRDAAWIVGLIDARAPKPAKPEPKPRPKPA